MKEKHHPATFRTHLSLLCMLLIFSIVSVAQQSTADTVVLMPSLDSAAVVEKVDQEASFQGDEDEDDTEADNVKEEDEKPKFATIGSAGSGLDSYNDRHVDTRLFNSDDEFWYANTSFEKKAQAKNNKRFQNTTLYQTLLWMLAVGGFIAFLIIYLSNSNISLFRRSKTMATHESDVDMDDIFAINYSSEIEKAVAAGNYRLAIRLHFLKLLRGMSERNIIQYTHDRTNFDYLLQVHHAPWYQQFFRITRNYEYVWYGQFDIDREKFDSINKDFDSLERQLPSI
jgi:hypothetical protein